MEVGGRADGIEALVSALAERSVTAVAIDAHVVDIDVSGQGDEVLDTVRDLVADLGLRLYALSSRHHSLDELFVEAAQRP